MLSPVAATQGSVTVSDLAPGRYLLTVDKAGYFQEGSISTSPPYRSNFPTS
jgi:hypothetical protein